MTTPVPEDLVERIRVAVASEVTKQAAALRLSTGQALDADDQQMLGHELINSEREFNPSRPSLNLQLPDGSRLFAVAWVCDRPCLAIRRHRLMKVTLDDLVGLGTIDVGLRDFLAAAVRARKQLIIAGATGVGKT